MSACWTCGEGCVIVDPASGAHVCDSCGTEHATGDFQTETFDSAGRPLGFFHHSVGEFGYRERKIRDSKAHISELTARLGLSGPRAAEAAAMVSDVTAGALGAGDWFPVLVGACSYLVMRRHRLPLPIAEVGAAVGRDIHEVGRMVSRVSQHLDLDPLPEFDAVQLLERAVRSCPCLAGLGKDKAEEVIGQGRFLLQCATKWFLTTGRQPLPLVGAIVAFVAEVNGAAVEVEEIAREIYASVATTKLRLKELMETLVRVARALLPWGADVTVKNLAQNAPVLIRLMELKSKSKTKSEGSEALAFDLNDLLPDVEEEEEDSKYFKVDDGAGFLNINSDELERLKLSGESLSRAHKNVLDRLSQIKERGGLGQEHLKKRKRGGFDFDALKDSWQWERRWESDKGLTLEQVLQKDVGYDALPPSFVAGVKARRSRRERIEGARRRIGEIMKPPLTTKLGPNGKENDSVSKSLVGKKRRRRGVGEDGIDWEDCIIELLLLHGADEEDIEQGQYRRF